MKVKEIKIDGFGVWTGLSVDSLQDGMTLFYGANEAGKTTLMQFLRAMLYGFDDGRRARYLPPAFGGKPGGVMQVSALGKDYEIERHRQLADSEISATSQVSVIGQDGVRQGHHRLATLLGQIDESIFTNVFAIGLRELQELSSLDDTEAADELYKLSSGLDRVSLVDVMRGLRHQRSDLVGSNRSSDPGKINEINQLVSKRDRLRAEVKEQIRHGKRWADIATQRLAQQQEINLLTERIRELEHEARCIEVASSVYETWFQRYRLKKNIDELESMNLLSEDAPKQLSEIESKLEQSQLDLETVKEKRRAIRRQAADLSINRQFLAKRGAVEVALQQLPWIETLEEQITLLDEQIDQAKQQFELDSTRLGFSESDSSSVTADRNLPDLSRESIATLSEPAQQVKQQVFRLRQAKSLAVEHQTRVEQLASKLTSVLEHARANDLRQAISEYTKDLEQLRHRIQLDEHLKKLKRHYRDLERETVDLTTAEALPVDRLVLLAVPFVFGAIAILHGASHLLGLTLLTDVPDTNSGLLALIVGAMALLFFYFGRENGTRRNAMDQEVCERQIDSLRKQIRGIEAERQNLNLRIAIGDESLESLVQEKESLLRELEANLPTYHHHEAQKQVWKLATEQAAQAEKELKKARVNWCDALELLGLSRSMSPSQVKSLGGDYERLQLSLRRVKDLQGERSLRQRERTSIAQRIDTLYREALESHPESRWDAGELDRQEGDEGYPDAESTDSVRQLRFLEKKLSLQLHRMKLRRELKEQDLGLKKQQLACSRTIASFEQRRAALWTRCGVDDAEQFFELVDLRAELVAAKKQHNELDQTLSKMIGPHLQAGEIAEVIENATADELETSWDRLTATISESEDRLMELQIQKGELTQEMKHLAEDSRLASLKLELACVEKKLASMIRQWQTLATTSLLLDDVCATFEKERQPETLREASVFLDQLTDGKYLRIWTSLGTNQLNVDDLDGKTLQVDQLSRGTREAVFIALRLSLAATYARRGVVLPLVLDDVLVNFDRERAASAAKTLMRFAQGGHQVLMFTCHQHIVEMFSEIGVEVRVMPPHGSPGRAAILQTNGRIVSDELKQRAGLTASTSGGVEVEASQITNKNRHEDVDSLADGLDANAQRETGLDPQSDAELKLNRESGDSNALEAEGRSQGELIDTAPLEESSTDVASLQAEFPFDLGDGSRDRSMQDLKTFNGSDTAGDTVHFSERNQKTEQEDHGIDWAWFEKDSSEINEEIIRVERQHSVLEVAVNDTQNEGVASRQLNASEHECEISSGESNVSQPDNDVEARDDSSISLEGLEADGSFESEDEYDEDEYEGAAIAVGREEHLVSDDEEEETDCEEEADEVELEEGHEPDWQDNDDDPEADCEDSDYEDVEDEDSDYEDLEDEDLEDEGTQDVA